MSYDHESHETILRRARMCLGKFRRMPGRQREIVLDAVASRLTRSLRRDGDGNQASLRLGIATLTEAREALPEDNTQRLIVETTLVCFQLLAPATPLSRADWRDAREFLDAIGQLITDYASERQLIALRAVEAWPYSGRNKLNQ